MYSTFSLAVVSSAATSRYIQPRTFGRKLSVSFNEIVKSLTPNFGFSADCPDGILSNKFVVVAVKLSDECFDLDASHQTNAQGPCSFPTNSVAMRSSSASARSILILFSRSCRRWLSLY